MNSETGTENQEKPAAEQSSSPPPGQGEPRRSRGGRGRSRFRRGGRGRGGDRDRERGERPPPHDPARGGTEGHGPAPAQEHHKGPATIGHAIQQIEYIRAELQKVLDEIHEALETLEQVEREKTASDEEIEMLRESLRNLQRDHGQGRPSRGSNPPLRTSYSAPPAPTPTPTSDKFSEEDED